MRFCPAWLYDYTGALVASEFLHAELPLESHAKRLAAFLEPHYEVVSPEDLTEAATGLLEFLSEIEAGDQADDFLTNFRWFVLNYENHNGVKRKRKSLLSTCFDPVKERKYDARHVQVEFRKYLFADRSDLLPKMPSGWQINQENDVELLKEMDASEPSFGDLLS